MGRYLVNGREIDIREAVTTALAIKTQLNCPPTDWVMASMPTGQVVKLNDADAIPATVENLSVVPAYEYGS